MSLSSFGRAYYFPSRTVERALGRPKGKFTQHRRLDRLREILEKHPRGISLYDLALTGRARGDPDGAEGHLKEGLALAAEKGDETSADYYLEAMAGVAGQWADAERAVRLLAAARSMLEARGSGWLHAYVPRVPPGDAELVSRRSRMGDAAFQEAQAWGRSAGSRRAAQYALQQA